jgi:hypothetical protein
MKVLFAAKDSRWLKNIFEQTHFLTENYPPGGGVTKIL